MDILGPEEKMFSSKHCLSKYTADHLKLFDVCIIDIMEKKLALLVFSLEESLFQKFVFPSPS